MSVSAWEAYVEHVVDDAIEALKPAVPPLGTWPALKASVSSARGRFNNPKPESVKSYIRDALGLEDVTDYWPWRDTNPQQSRERLSQLLKLRHQIAHGVHPRPTVNHGYASQTSTLVRRLAERTDAALRDHLGQQVGTVVAW